MRKRYLYTAVLAVLCCLLTGCSELSLSAADLLTPPMAQGSQSALQSLITESAGGSYSPVYPASGNYQNAVIFRDLDGDGEEEAIALYRGADEAARVLFARREGSGYASLGEANLTDSPIEKVDFADLDGNGREECVVIYPDSASPLYSLSVIDIGDTITRADMPGCCNTVVTCDLDGNDVRDILLLCLSNTSSTASAKLIGYQEGALHIRTSCEMDSQLSDYFRITCGDIGTGVSGVAVDGHTLSGEYTTQLLYLSDATGELENPLFIYAGYESTRRAVPVSCADVDHDGAIEFPVCALCDHAEDEDVHTVCSRITWNGFVPADTTLVSKKTTILCDQQHFMFHISDGRAGAVTARYADDDTVAFYRWEYKDNALRRTDLLLTVRRYARDSYDSEAVSEPVLSDTAAGVYTYAIAPVEGTYGYTDDEVVDSFVPTD